MPKLTIDTDELNIPVDKLKELFTPNNLNQPDLQKEINKLKDKGHKTFKKLKTKTDIERFKENRRHYRNGYEQALKDMEKRNARENNHLHTALLVGLPALAIALLIHANHD